MSLLERWRRWWSWPQIEIDPLPPDRFRTALERERSMLEREERARVVAVALATAGTERVAIRPRPGEILIVQGGEIVEAVVANVSEGFYFGPVANA